MTKTFCDLCGEEITKNNFTSLKLKKEWHWLGQSGWDLLTVHNDCWDELRREIKKRRTNND